MARRRNENHEKDCALKCLACERPADNFGHLHIARLVDGVPVEPPEITALCVPCLASMARSYEHMVAAYLNGGIQFDDHVKKIERQLRGTRRRSRAQGGTPLPPWALEVMQDIHESIERGDTGDGDDTE